MTRPLSTDGWKYRGKYWAIAFGTVATRKWSPFRSPASGRVSTIAGDVLTVAIILLFIALPALFAGV